MDTDLGEADILARARAGDTDAFAELVRRHAPVAIRVATVLGAGAEAEDAVQEAFVKAYRSLDRFRPGAPFRPWLLKILVNEVSNQRRSAGRRAVREQSWWLRLEPLLGDGDPAGPAIAASRRAELVAALAGLPDNQRQVVTCRYLLDLDETETAAALGLARGTVKSRLHRGLRQLAERVDRTGDGEVQHDA